MPSFKEALSALKSGEVIAVPTDTVYGLVGRGDLEGTIKRIYEIKRRPIDKPLVLFVGGTDELEKYAELDRRARLLAEKYWPGPLTLVLRAKDNVPSMLIKEGKAGFRVPNHPLVLELLKELKIPLASTSANISGEPPLLEAEEVERVLGGSVKLILGERSFGEIPSTVVDTTGDRVKILRKGAIPIVEIEEILDEEVVLVGDSLVIYFVCTGNTCRSPMAEFIFKSLLPDDLKGRVLVHSRGTSTIEGMPISDYAVRVLEELGIENVVHYSKPIDEDDIRSGDLFLCMEYFHIERLRDLGAGKKAILFGGSKGEIEDPIGEPIDVYRRVRDKIRGIIEEVWIPYTRRKFEA